VTRGFPTIAAVLGLLFFMASPCPAQGVKSVLQSLSGNAQPPPAEPSMAEQLDWARTRLSEAGSDEKALSDIEEKLKQADLPSSLIEDFRAAARETRRNYQNAVDLLSGLVTMEGTPATPVTPPATEEQASSMRDSLRRATLAATAAEGEIELFKRLSHSSRRSPPMRSGRAGNSAKRSPRQKVRRQKTGRLFDSNWPASKNAPPTQPHFSANGSSSNRRASFGKPWRSGPRCGRPLKAAALTAS